jgi:hypothetical protein
MRIDDLLFRMALYYPYYSSGNLGLNERIVDDTDEAVENPVDISPTP